ncbi:MAG: hypothetical protein ACKOJ7_07900 [Betaproteobacteria bacterium]
MRAWRAAGLAALALIVVQHGHGLAQTTTSSAQNKAPAPAEKARAAARKATTAAGAAAAAAATATALVHASEEQRHAFSLAHLGEYQCEFKRMVRVLANPVHEGYVDLHFDKHVVTARPVLSSTGAVRLEDVRGRFLMVQIAFKSMLMDTKIGQRVADDCQHDHHRDARRAAADAPPSPGLGIGRPAALPDPPAAATAPITVPAAAPSAAPPFTGSPAGPSGSFEPIPPPVTPTPAPPAQTVTSGTGSSLI